MRGETRYSEELDGDKGNHDWSVQLDWTDGYLGITQETTAWDGGAASTERVLLSPSQVKGLLAFVVSRGRSIGSPSPKGKGDGG